MKVNWSEVKKLGDKIKTKGPAYYRKQDTFRWQFVIKHLKTFETLNDETEKFNVIENVKHELKKLGKEQLFESLFIA